MNWEEILSEITAIKKNTRVVWFRGHSRANYELKSSLFRQNIKDIEHLIINERTRYNYFKNLGFLSHKKSDWDLLYTMQHYKSRTRLLDWTEAFSTALYFAYSEWEKNKPITIWVLKPLAMNNKVRKGPHFYVPTVGDLYIKKLSTSPKKPFSEFSMALHPVRDNPRIVAQQGVFTLQGNNFMSLDEEHGGELVSEGILKRFDIAYSDKDKVKVFLDLSGVNAYTVYPDLEGLANYINEFVDIK